MSPSWNGRRGGVCDAPLPRLPTPAVNDAWLERSVASVTLCVCLWVFSCVCPRCKRKMTWAINTKLGTHTVFGRTSAALALGSKGQCRRVMKCAAAGMGGYARRYDCLGLYSVRCTVVGRQQLCWVEDRTRKLCWIICSTVTIRPLVQSSTLRSPSPSTFASRSFKYRIWYLHRRDNHRDISWRYVALVVVLWRPALSASSSSASVTALRWKPVNVHV